MQSLFLSRVATACVVLICVCLPAWPQQSTPAPPPNIVHVDAAVLFEGHAVTGLTPGDFIVLDQKKPRQVLSFAASEQPLDVLILFDVSSSMLAGVQSLAAGAHDALGKLHAGDRVGIMVHDGHSRVLLPF